MYGFEMAAELVYMTLGCLVLLAVLLLVVLGIVGVLAVIWRVVKVSCRDWLDVEPDERQRGL